MKANDLLARSVDYPAFIRGKPCLVCGVDGVDAHHLEAVGMGNNRKRESYRHLTCVPLCREHHGEVHAIGLSMLGKDVNPYREALPLLIEFLTGTPAPFHNDQGLR